MPDLIHDPTPKVAIGHQLEGGANYVNVIWPGMKWKYLGGKICIPRLGIYHTGRLPEVYVV